MARLLNVDRSAVLKYAKTAVKVGKFWQIGQVPKIKKTARNSSKCYTQEELELIKSNLPDYAVAEKTGRTVNAVHIKRWRLKYRR